MDLITLVLFVCLIGFLVWLLTTYIPMPPEWAQAIRAICLVLLIIYLVSRLFNIPNILR